MNTWQLQEAKNRLSQVVDQALTEGPQTITRHGKPTVVVLSVDDYQARTELEGSIVDFFMQAPLRGTKLDVKRDDDLGRDIYL